MGTSGARTGYKIYSINTTIRNPKRNYDFLLAFEKFDGQVMDEFKFNSYLFELVKKGIYQFNNLSQTIKEKLEQDIELTPAEVNEAISNNPQATGWIGRIMTMLRALKDLGLLVFEDPDIRSTERRISFSKLGKELIENPDNATNIYTKIMLGLHANNPCRVNLLNESRPFLNTLFVINEVNKKWKELGHEPKGILQHEFATFVLSMKDCDYRSAANNIISYRLENQYEINKVAIKDYLESNDILELKWNSLLKDYPDEVFRKFEMTGLIVKHGLYNYTYLNFSQYNMEKIQAILNEYSNYEFLHFDNALDYYSYQQSITLPWETSDIIRQQIVKAKADVLGIPLNEELTIDEQEDMLDRFFYNKALTKAVERYDINTIFKELLILSGTIKGKSKFEDISEPLRLEYLLALSIGKKYGTKGLVSNIIYNEDGLPLHCAPASKCDVIFHDIDGSYILEPTMIRSRAGQMNNETTNVVRHVKAEEQRTKLTYRVMMVAPYIHPDVVDFFQYKHDREKVKIMSLNIDWVVKMLFYGSNVKELNDEYDLTLEEFEKLDNNAFVDLINGYKFCVSLDN